MLTEQRVLAFLSLCVLGAVLMLGGLEREPPEPPARPDERSFSVERAVDDLEWIAAESHPMGSPAHRAVRERLVRELESIGLSVQVDGGFVPSKTFGPTQASIDWVENVIARLPGRGGNGSLWITSHYDSAGTGPGAGDDGAAVAAMLETARALAAAARTDGPFQNDVCFLFTDGEEIGLLGARHHVAAGVGRDDVLAVLNFEARGTSGPSILFETSRKNAGLIRAYCDEVEEPVASSLAYEVYRRMPNDTDFTVFKEAGWIGLNFAFIGSHENYHTANDSREELDPRSLAHHGTTMLLLALRLANADLGALNSDERTSVFFGVARRFAVSYPLAVQHFLSCLALVALGLAIRAGIRRDRLCRGSLIAGVLSHLAVFLASCVVSAILVRFVTGIDDSERLRFWRVVVDGPRHLPAHLLLATSIATFTLLQTRTKTRADGAYAGALIVMAFALLVAMFAAPTACYVLSWPLTFAAIGLYTFVSRPKKGRLGGARFACIALSLLPSGLLMLPVLAFGAEALTFAAAPVTTAGFLLALLPATPLLLAVMAVRRLLLPLATMAAAFAVLIHAIWNGTLAEQPPREARIEYVVDAARGVACFASADSSEMRSMFPGVTSTEIEAAELIPGPTKGKRHRVAAQTSELPEATFELMRSELDAQTRTSEFRIRFPRGASSLSVRIPKESRAWVVSIGGKEPTPKQLEAERARQLGDVVERHSATEFRLRGEPREVIVVRVTQPIDVPLAATVVTRSFGLPPLPPGANPPRPWLVPASWSADESVTYRSLTF